MFLPEETWDALFELLGRRPDKEDAESIQNEVECLLTVYPLQVAMGDHKIRPAGIRKQFQRILDAAEELDAALVDSTEFFWLEHSEDFRKALDVLIDECKNAIGFAGTGPSRHRPRRQGLRHTVQYLSRVFERHYWPGDGARHAEDRDAFILTALKAAGIPKVPKSPRQLRRYLTG